MSVSVEIISSLSRRLTIKVPAEQVREKVKAQLARISQKAKIDGFRPGKIPASVIEKRFGALAHSEAIDELLQSSLRKALLDENLHPATQPVVQSLKAEPNMPLEYNVTFDIFPEIKLVPLSDVTLEKLIVPIEEADVDQVLQQMRQLHVLWEDVQRPAQVGDRITVDIQGMLNGEPVEKLHDKNVPLVLDEATLPPVFLGLIGAQTGDSITLDLSKDKNAPAAQGVSHLLVTIHAVAESKLPEVDTAFAKKLGVVGDSVEALRADVRKHMTQEVDRVLKGRLKEQVLEALVAHHPLELPHAAIEEEFRHLENDLRQRIKQETKQKTDVQLSKTDREKLQSIARRRVALGLIFPTIIKEYKLKADDKRVAEHINRLMGAFENSETMLKSLSQNPKMMEQIQAQVLEEQAVDKLLSQVQFKEKTISYQQALELGKAPHDHKHHGHDHPSDAPVR